MRPFLLAVLLLACSCSDEPARPPDILLVSIDSLRADHLSCYGYERPTSPTLDRLAQEGVRFTNAVSTTSWTLPSHAALFTGLYDSSHGLVDNGLKLGRVHRTLAEMLGLSGWVTVGFFGGPYLHPTFGLDQGFRDYVSCMTTVPDDLTDEQLRAESRSVTGAAHRDVTGPRTLERVREWLVTNVDAKGADAHDDPFLMFVHLWDVHYDYYPPEEYIELFDPGYEGPVDGVDVLNSPAIHPEMPERDFAHLMALYDAEIRSADDTLAGILAELKKRGRLANTLVVVFSDHGEEFFEHGRIGHQKTLFEEVVRIPLIVTWADKLAGGQVIDDQVRLIDVMPTVTALVGHPLDFEVQGRDLSPLLTGGSLPPEEALTELLLRHVRLRALRTNKEKTLVVGPGQFIVYDLEQDPGEQAPLAGNDPRVERGGRSLRRAREDAVIFRERFGARAVERADVGQELTNEINRLGYGGGDDEEPDDDR